MIAIVWTLATLIALVIAGQCIFVALEILASVALPRRRGPAGSDREPQVCVVIPAHDESRHIADTVARLRLQIRPEDRLIVVADNCSDDTASLARAAGAEVIERNDPVEVGKGYALAYGVSHLRVGAPPDVVVFVDADCRLGEGSLNALAKASALTGRPAQATNLMTAPAGAGRGLRLAEFAWRVKNLARPLGAFNLGLPVQLTGTGMAIPWGPLQAAQLGSGHIAEDVKIGVELATAGFPPIFCPEARVLSEFPQSERGARDQRTRWEHGHLSNIVEFVLPMAVAALKQRRPDLLAMLVDLSVPPLAVLFMATVAANVVFLIPAVALNFGLAAGLARLGLLALGFAVGLGWLAYGRDLVSLRELALTPFYALSKLPMLWRFLTKRQILWVRADRGPRPE